MLESEVDMNDHDEETLASLQQANDQLMAKTVSYTHLTLPTIRLV